MNKAAFSDELRRHLKSLPNAERNQHIEYYEEMIEDRMEDGLSEEEAVAALGTVSDIAIQILGDSPQKSPRKFRIWEIILIVLGSPLWLSLLICIAAAVLCIVLSVATVYLILWVCIATLYCGVLALAAGCAAAIWAALPICLTHSPDLAFCSLAAHWSAPAAQFYCSSCVTACQFCSGSLGNGP